MHNDLLMRRLTRFIAGCAVSSVLCFAFALLDIATGVLRGITLLAGQWVAMTITFTLIGWGAWEASGVIVRSIAEERLPRAPRLVAFSLALVARVARAAPRLPWAPRQVAFSSEVDRFTVVNALPSAAAATAAVGSGVRSERVRRIERMVEP